MTAAFLATPQTIRAPEIYVATIGLATIGVVLIPTTTLLRVAVLER
jgi:hypothetical protein